MHLAPTDDAAGDPAGGAPLPRRPRSRASGGSTWDQTAGGLRPGVLAGGRPARLVRLRRCREAYGGQGASLLDLGLLVEECGRAVAPFGIFAADRRRARARRARHARRRSARGSPPIARGEKLVDARGRRARRGRSSRRVHDRRSAGAASSSRLDGEKRYVLQGVTADAFLVAARDGRGRLARAGAGRRAGRDGRAASDASARIARAASASPDVDAAGDRARRRAPGAAWPRARAAPPRASPRSSAPTSIGGADAVLDMTVALRRRARAVRRQARHLPGGAADGAPSWRSTLEGARHVTRQALWRLAEGLPADARGRDRQGVDGARLPRHHAHRAPAPRRRRLRRRARAASPRAARQGGRAALRLDRGVARGPRRRSRARAARVAPPRPATAALIGDGSGAMLAAPATAGRREGETGNARRSARPAAATARA